MQADAIVERYIRNAYRGIREVPPESEYDNTVLGVVAAFAEFLTRRVLVPEFPEYEARVIYAFDKTSSVISIRDRIVVVYNRFFAQTLNNLNKLLHLEPPSEGAGYPMFCYLFRLMKEQAYVEGCDEFAIFISTFCDQYRIKPELDRFLRVDPSNQLHLLDTSVQEAFILAHEIVHVLVSTGRLHVVRRGDFRLSRVLTGLYDRLLSAAEREILERGTPPVDDPGFDEEMFCDDLAFQFVVEFFQNMEDPAGVFCAVKCFQMHMRVFGLLRDAFRKADHHRRLEGSGPSAAPYVADQSWARHWSEDFRIPPNTPKFEPLSMLMRWSDLQDAHHERITSPALSVVQSSGSMVSVDRLCFDMGSRAFSIRQSRMQGTSAP